MGDIGGATPEMQGRQVRGMRGTGEVMVGGVGRRAAGWAAVGGGSADRSLVAVESWAVGTVLLSVMRAWCDTSVGGTAPPQRLMGVLHLEHC